MANLKENEAKYPLLKKFSNFNQSAFELDNDAIINLLKNDFKKEEIEVLSIFYESQFILPVGGDVDDNEVLEKMMKINELMKMTIDSSL